MNKNLKQDHYDTKSFEQKILQYQPQLVCYNGKDAAKVYFNLKYTKQVSYGLQDKTMCNTKLYVAPSNSCRLLPNSMKAFGNT